ncbi:MAG: tRNA (adenosine(37)-N6)-threonylcarbamoyltransferase complex ATPase subunit type 1 TsaE [Anaerolineae bacterium UTCFX2]|jgi:tRNA threonylcarbamoyladenosine biosynthesis protein TsaE|nr:tRNA (adenosine(37)-N6)-threonylcarbamoyltransferase complex ATPase subunit type 1 TsaE [Anaerolineae bacterium]MCZ7552354.1 tRNA (adenosine(37)-N6)-threonylcarbamoyltransferase complex ATPase subunit type 1 TsaE [Anaerolineales bacterium]OQY91849.1 MAG: tRNA (adenosine(37)-N6)-threonylcarbamoyltransferase complex ATPase subunit type 1 TsaE [Anaerolineae bacterium UTCFX2]
MPILNRQSLEFISRSPDQTRRAGMRMGALLQTGDLICLAGELGAGKTTLVQGLASGWGSLDAATSPTFVLVNVYRRPDHARLYHLDAYRLSSPAEAAELDLDALLDSGPLVIEWADRIASALPDERLWVNMRLISETQRDMVLSAQGKRYSEMIDLLRRQFYGVHA